MWITEKQANLRCVLMKIIRFVSWIPYFFSPPFSSLGCGIGYGYLHRIPTKPFEEGKKISFPGNSPSEPVSPLKDGFTEVRTHIWSYHLLQFRLEMYEMNSWIWMWLLRNHNWNQSLCNNIVYCPKILPTVTLSVHCVSLKAIGAKCFIMNATKQAEGQRTRFYS